MRISDWSSDVCSSDLIHSMQSLWVPYIENVQNSYLSYWGSPQRFTENYSRAVSNITDNTIVATRLANNNLFASMDAWKNSIVHARDKIGRASCRERVCQYE